MIILKKTKIIGRTVTTVYNDKDNHDDGSLALAKLDSSEIVLISEEHAKRLGIKRDTIEESFIHEIVHHINFSLGFNNENREEYVLPFSAVLYQVIKQIIKAQKSLKKDVFCDTIQKGKRGILK
jgi:hypothetical protein